jgi:Asp-tRNA(Asn)/Glu-tRNA(Gln) amidotransferase A subunit family amidase
MRQHALDGLVQGAHTVLPNDAAQFRLLASRGVQGREQVDSRSVLTDQVEWSAVANVAGGPATAIIVRRGRSGLPIGLQAMRPGGGDLSTIEFAALLGREAEGFVPPPALVQI